MLSRMLAEPSEPPSEPAAVWVRTAELVPWDNNPKAHEPGQVDRICASIRATAEDAARERGQDPEADPSCVNLLDGWGAALTARLKDRQIVAGHGRVLAAERLGIEWLPVRFLDISAKQAERLTRADNRIAELAGTHTELLLEQLAADAAESADLLYAQGFDESSLEQMLEQQAEAVPDVEEAEVVRVDTSALRAEFWMTVRGPVPSQPEVLQRLVRELGDVEGVTADVGIVK